MTPTTPKTVTVSREQLYAQVWTTPMRKLANEYGLSDVGLAKVCKRHDIPRPPVGYWAKKEVGKATPQPPLPKNEQRSIQPIKLWDGPRAVPAQEPPMEYDEEIQGLLQRVEALPPVQISGTLHSPHPLVRATRDALAEGVVDGDSGMVSPTWMKLPNVIEVTVAKSNIRRAMLFLDALCKAVEKIGGRIAVEREHHRERHAATVRVGNIVLSKIRIRERYKQCQRDKSDKHSIFSSETKKVATGRLLLDRAPAGYEKPYCEDSDKTDRRIEDQINQILIQWVHEAGRTRAKMRREAEEERLREEQRRIRKEREAELQRRRDEFSEKQMAEQSRVDQLLKEAKRWQQSRTVRAYLNALEKMLAQKESSTQREEFANWMKWAQAQADRLDPLVPSPHSILDEEFEDV